MVQGAEKRPAAENFASDVLETLEKVHKTSVPQQHIIGSLQVIRVIKE